MAFTDQGQTKAALLVIAALLVAPCAEAAPPAEAFGRLPAVDQVEISPDGKHIAMIQAYHGRNVVAIYKVGAPEGTHPNAFDPQDVKARGVRWANNERLLVTLSVTHKTHVDRWNRMFEFVRILSMNTLGQDQKFLFRGRSFQYMVGSGRLLSMLPDDPDHVLMAHVDPSGNLDGVSLNVYKVNVRTGKESETERGAPETFDWIVDSGGQVRMRIDDDGKNDRNRIYMREGSGRFRHLTTTSDEDESGDPVSFWGFGADPGKIYVTARRGGDRLGLHLFDLATGTIVGKTFTHDRVDIGDVLIDPYTDLVIGAVFTEHAPEAVYFDADMADLYRKLKAAFTGYSISIVSSSRNGARHIVLAHNAREPGVYYYFDDATRQAFPLGARYPELQPKDLGEVKAISYEARDGLVIPAYLTLPPGKEPKNLPLVLLPHGGPAVRDDQTFHWWAQFYASRGYAVLQPNFRGSSGYGSKFRKAGHGEFGGKMQDDLTDGVKYAVAQGIADPKRVCIVGASYGGYAALAGAALTPDIYACAVSVAGISDLATFLGSVIRASGYRKRSYGVQYWQRWIGQRASDAAQIESISPARHADAIRAPVLLIHGKDDTVVTYRQSERMAEALEKAGKPHKLVTLEGEDHNLTQAESRIRILKETEVFLKAHIGG